MEVIPRSAGLVFAPYSSLWYFQCMVNHIATIPKRVSGGEELVVVKRRDFEKFRKWQKETQDALAKIKRGRAEYRNGKTIAASSPKRFR